MSTSDASMEVEVGDALQAQDLWHGTPEEDRTGRTNNVASFSGVPFSEGIGNRVRDLLMPILLEKIRSDHFPGGEVPQATLERARALLTDDECRKFISTARALAQSGLARIVSNSLERTSSTEKNTLQPLPESPKRILEDNDDSPRSAKRLCLDMSVPALVEPPSAMADIVENASSLLPHPTSSEPRPVVEAVTSPQNAVQSDELEEPHSQQPSAPVGSPPPDSPATVLAAETGAEASQRRTESMIFARPSFGIPGLWAVVQCTKLSSTHEFSFTIDQDTLAAVTRWALRFKNFE
ncbi:hypothetical protein K488DRAFT_83677 [Vararia minispora EC-137]|uniref:Uncharacterized protein n=1 Tax=Vararia minispora EC-137 TaxID=1314806 RepID=A0ACB8QSD6_9AGAM|nr:hypothetical protein K488DRAFT_83677 [Vararia minispora EC-137]